MILRKTTTTILFATLIGCGGEMSPGEVIRSAEFDIANRKFDSAVSAMAMEQIVSAGITPDKLQKLLEHHADAIADANCRGLRDVVIISEEISGDKAMVAFSLECNSGSKTPFKAQLTKTKDGWRILP